MNDLVRRLRSLPDEIPEPEPFEVWRDACGVALAAADLIEVQAKEIEALHTLLRECRQDRDEALAELARRTPTTDLDARWISGHAIEPDWPSRGGAQRVVSAEQAEALAKEIERLRNDIHSCGPTCDLAGCVNARLRSAMASAEEEAALWGERARHLGWKDAH